MQKKNKKRAQTPRRYTYFNQIEKPVEEDDDEIESVNYFSSLNLLYNQIFDSSYENSDSHYVAMIKSETAKKNKATVGSVDPLKC